jgi:hypothetical protein
MKTTKLKSNIHEIVDRIQSEQLLETIYDFLKTRETTRPGEIWNSLTDEQKREVVLSFEESEDEKNLVDIDQGNLKKKMRISFTKRAQNNYKSIKIYLSDEWGEKSAEAFEQKTIDFFDLLKEFPELGSIEFPEKQIRGFQLTKQTRIALQD